MQFIYTLLCIRATIAGVGIGFSDLKSPPPRTRIKMRWLRGETNCLSQSCAIQIVVVFVSLPTRVPMLLRSSPQEATRAGRTHSPHPRRFAKQSGATCVPQRPLTSFPPSFRAFTRKHLGARRGRPPGRPRGVKRCPGSENAPFSLNSNFLAKNAPFY